MKKDIIGFLIVISVMSAGIFCGFVASNLTIRAYDAWTQPRVVLKYVENSGDNRYAPIVAAKSLAKAVYEKTDGQVRIDVYTAAGNDMKNYIDLQTNRIDMARMPTNMAAKDINETLMVLSFPYLLRDQEHKWRVINSHIGEEAEKELSSRGMVVLAWLEDGTRQLINRRHPIRSPKDAADMETSYLNDSMTYDAMKCLTGREPYSIPTWQVYRNLINGQIDACEINWTIYGSTCFYEAARFITETGHSQSPCIQVITQQALDKLTPKEQEILKECAQEVAEKERELFNRDEAYYKHLALENGAILTELSDKEKKQFEEKFESIYQKTDRKDLVNEIKSM